LSKFNLCILSFDVEDWFQAPNLKDRIRRDSWESKELRVKENTRKLLSILDKYDTKATFFILGWVAERVPDLVREIHTRGHEIACHGYDHELIYNLSVDGFRKDIRKSKKILSDLTGEKILGYRASCFSITEWAIDVLKEEGFKYDSSFFPSMAHDRYGKLISANKTRSVQEVRSGFFEVLIPTLDFMGIRVPWGGGAYFRLIPYVFYKRGVRLISGNGGVFVFYLHSWEIDPLQPHVHGIRLQYKIRHYGGLRKTEDKLKRLLKDFQFDTIKSGLEKLGFL